MSHKGKRAVVIGGSAGSVEALSVVLPVLPQDFPLPIMIVVHLPAYRKSLLADLFQSKCHVRVLEADDKEPICAGAAYFAPPDYHLLVEADARLSLSSDEPVRYSRPSIDVLFESASDVYADGLVGVVLTGANSDGANGLRVIGEAGGIAIAQRPDSSYASTMPQAAIDACPTALCLNLDEIASYLLKLADEE